AHGWSLSLHRNVERVVESLSELPLAAILVTAVHRDGTLAGPDLPLVADVVDAAGEIPVLAAGGVASLAHLDSLADSGVAGTIVGMALYEGSLEPRVVASEYGGGPGPISFEFIAPTAPWRRRLPALLTSRATVSQPHFIPSDRSGNSFCRGRTLVRRNHESGSCNLVHRRRERGERARSNAAVAHRDSGAGIQYAAWRHAGARPGGGSTAFRLCTLPHTCPRGSCDSRNRPAGC